jgi:anti-anti-sigma regulatory factor
VTTLLHHREPGALVLTPHGSIGSDDVPELLATAARLLDGEPGESVVIDLSLVGRPDLWTIEVLMRLRLSTLRRGRPLLIRHTPAPLAQVLEYTGLSAALPLREACDCRVCGQV